MFESALWLPLTVCGFAKAGLFSATAHLKNRTSIIRKNCQPKHSTPAFAKPMLADALLSSCRVKRLNVKCRCVPVCVVLSPLYKCDARCVGKKLKTPKGGKRKNKILLGLQKNTLLQFWVECGL